MSAAAPPDLATVVDTFRRIPHCQLLDMRMIAIAPGCGTALIPYRPALVANVRTGVIHGGVITTLLDTLSGIVVMTTVPAGTPLATLDLRIDYLHPATPGSDIRGRVECYKTTPNIAFVRGVAFHTDEADPIAHCAGTFMLGAMGFRPPTAADEAPAPGNDRPGGQPC
ncbi:MAG: PaaI family thioesterase [Rhodospirillales bacterium]|jgi:uncharacterized protein (TIGR00369 family)|nr:PaaI family thioesterase [Rhodospirillales bacterium]